MSEKRKLVCATCGTDSVHIKAWVDANTSKFIGEIPDQPAWCDYCESPTSLEYIIEDEKESCIIYEEGEEKG